ncbi:hypothetical protein [Methylorubrum extorquens]|uniref:Lipoprotein n=1 Tax=Methylorubrum extorquens (strain CM4 / NCIMB 13688) TaxID=440085 RepID=B7KTT6_METC4|nr:hypothetical protein [Methylorubrum extorquens]ACK84146.1 hypothetical protein Mchl_3311 [Methylorubrum extorquens CM4]
MKSIAVFAVLAAALSPCPVQADCLRDRGLACYATEQKKPDTTRGGISASEFCAASAVIECGQSSSSAGGGRVMPSDINSERKRFDHLPTARSADTSATKAEDIHASRFAVKDGWIISSPGSRYGEKPEIKPYIKYNNSLIEEFDDVFLSIDGFVSAGRYAVLLYSTNPGGSGTVDSHSLVAVDDNGKIYRADLPAGHEHFEYRVANRKIDFELGINDGKQIRAVFDDGRLSVTKTPIQKGNLGDDDCNMIYNGIMDECARPDQTTCIYDDMTISMARQRPINSLAYDNPNFKHESFKSACEQACKVKRKPALAGFRKAVCQAR